MKKYSLKQAIIMYRTIYKKVNGHEPVISPWMTAGELIGHSQYWYKQYAETKRHSV